MQIETKIREVSPTEYFNIHKNMKFCERNEYIEVVWVSLPAVGFRLILLLPPQNYCWGMQFRLNSKDKEWLNAQLQNSEIACAYKKTLEYYGVNPATVPVTLAGCEVFGSESEFVIGTEANELPRLWFRSVIIPDTTDYFSSFINRLKLHVVQLGKFFILQQPSMGESKLVHWSESVHSELELLFGVENNPSSHSLFKKKLALQSALELVSGEDAFSLLTPRFLDWDMLRINYPVADMPKKSKRTDALLSLLSLLPFEENNKQIKELALLQSQLLNKWRWPVGVWRLSRNCHDHAIRNVLLNGDSTWKPLEEEVTKILVWAQNSYPLLLD